MHVHGFLLVHQTYCADIAKKIQLHLINLLSTFFKSTTPNSKTTISSWKINPFPYLHLPIDLFHVEKYCP